MMRNGKTRNTFIFPNEPLIFEVQIKNHLAACGTLAEMVQSQSRDPGQEPEPPVCHLRQNTQKHEDIFL